MEHAAHNLSKFGLEGIRIIRKNLSPEDLYRAAAEKHEAVFSSSGVLTAYTGKYTGRSPKDKFIVRNDADEKEIHWAKNAPLEKDRFDGLFEKMKRYIKRRDELYLFEGMIGADEKYTVPIRVYSEYAWHSLFAHIMFRKNTAASSEEEPLSIFVFPGCEAAGEKDGVRSEAFIAIDFQRRMVLIGGTRYAGEIKKSAFTFLNYLLPKKGVLPMHCSATVGDKGDVALYFGLSGTGKTTLSADPARRLIGDDEHGWSRGGVFNFEGGCYAKCINLDPEKEPQIFRAIRPGAVVENVVLKKEMGEFDFSDGSLTENTRAAYPLSFIPDAVESGVGGHPKNIFFLTADAFGVLPPISRLDADQAAYYFLCGYTSKLAGTERGIKEPEANFSLFFGEPFMPLVPERYMALFRSFLKTHDSRVYLVNTGWTGGPYGIGSRISLRHTRALVGAALEGAFDSIEFVREPFFGLHIPVSCPAAPSELLNPKKSWRDKAHYDKKAKELAAMFKKNFEKYQKRRQSFPIF